jgi:hypothetical protein
MRPHVQYALDQLRASESDLRRRYGNQTGKFDYSNCMRTQSRSAFLLSIVFTLLLCFAPAACSETAPCALLTQDQVSRAVGAAMGAGSPIANTGCSWTTTSAPRVMVTVSMQNEKMFAAAKSSALPKMEKTSVSGVGDEAVFLGVQSFSSLWVRKGTKFLLLRIYGLPVSDAQTKLKTLGANAVSKL